MSGEGSYFRSNVVCNYCGKKGNIHIYCKSNRNVYSGNPSMKSINNLP